MTAFDSSFFPASTGGKDTTPGWAQQPPPREWSLITALRMVLPRVRRPTWWFLLLVAVCTLVIIHALALGPAAFA